MLEDDDEFDDYVSKSHFKREAEAVQEIGERLIDLSVDKLNQLDLPENLMDAVLLAKRLTAHGALRRQRQYIGKLMRRIDPEPIQAKFEEWERTSRSQLARFHQLERWRERLLADEQAVGALMETYPALDIQRVRSLVRNAKKEQAANKPPKSSRELFQYLRELAEI